MYLATDELDAVFDRAEAAGERPFSGLDPDGNQLCFVDDATLFLGHGAEWA